MSTTTTHSDLCNLYSAQRRKYIQWQAALFEQSMKLRDAFAVAIASPGTYQDSQTSEHRPYVSVLEYEDTSKPFTRTFADGAINQEGVLRVLLSVTLEQAPNSYPKERLQFPIGIQFLKGVANYCIWNRDNEMVSTVASWTPDLSKIVAAAQQLAVNYLNHDPMDGFSDRKTIGFLQA